MAGNKVRMVISAAREAVTFINDTANQWESECMDPLDSQARLIIGMEGYWQSEEASAYRDVYTKWFMDEFDRIFKRMQEDLKPKLDKEIEDWIKATAPTG